MGAVRLPKILVLTIDDFLSAQVGDVEMTLHKTFLSIVGTQEAPVRNVRVLGIGMRDTSIRPVQHYHDLGSLSSLPPKLE